MSSHCAVSKALSGVKILPDFSVPICGFGQDNYRRLPYRIEVMCSNSATGVEIVKKRDFSVGFIFVRFFR